MPIRVGCVYLPQFAPAQLAETARAADAAGLNELWLWEDCFVAGGIAAAAVALSNSTRLTVGIGVLPVGMRNVAATAMEIATLGRAFPGRVRVGVGHGVQDWMGQIGARVASPMTLLREYLTTLRALLDGERVTFAGTYVTLTDVALDCPPYPGMEVLCAAMGPRTLGLSGELADGTVIAGGTTPESVREAVGHVNTGRATHLDPTPHSVIAYVLCATGADAKARVEEDIQRWGYDPDSDIAAYGSPVEIAEAAGRWIDAGVDTIVLQPGLDVDIAAFVTAIATEVQPLILQARA
jgi:alkanesulfonate monooxygenase SsuD/methylene tetrahydromethanopterin reductase-like flavin-dependent oxidoreductase (luciferase family)